MSVIEGMKRKKIAVVGIRGIPATYGGIEKHCEMLYPIMVKNGFYITVYARSYYCKGNDTEFQGVKIKKVPVINIKGFESFMHSFLTTVIATFSDADIIHFHAQGPAIFSWIPRIFTPWKMICFTCNGIDKDREKWGKVGKFILTLGEIASAKFPHCKIGVSEDLKNYYEKKYKIIMHKVYNGISVCERLELNNCQRFDIEPDKYFMFVGRLVPEKAPETLIKAFKQVETNKKLLIVGGSAGNPEYVKQLKELASDDKRIIFTYYIYGDELKELYSNAFAYISSSRLEGLPLTILEAMSFSLPVILSNIPPHMEIINQGYDVGTSFEVDNIESCKKSIERILNLPHEQIQEMKISSKKLVKDIFDWEKVGIQTIDIFNNAYESLKNKK
jgi:glycosyltransferase involved in cell wall biosynthesis